MSVAAIAPYLNTAARLIAPHYIKVTAAAITVFGGVWAGKRRWNLSYYEKLDASSTRVDAKLKVLNPKASNWNNGNAHDAKELLQILYDVCAENNPLPHLEFVGPKQHFQDAVKHVKTLTTIANRVSAAQDTWLKETKGKAEEWLKAKDKLGRDASHDVAGWEEDDKAPILSANNNLLNAIIKAKKKIGEEKVTAETIQLWMAPVKEKYDILYDLVGTSEIEILVGKSSEPIKKWFSDDDYGHLKELSDTNLNDTYIAQGKIKDDDKTNVNKAIADLKLDKLLNAVNRQFTDEDGTDSAAKTADIEFHKWNQDGSGLYNPLLGCTAAALAILAVNWGASHYLGADHHIVQLFKLPA